MSIEFKLENNILTIYLGGRVDSMNANEVEAKIFEIDEQNPAKDVVLDIENLEYISSAGLRVLLKLRKAHAGLKIINACPDVYDVFEMTGFSEMIHIEKAYRKLSIDGCEVIGEGANGKVYRLDRDTIIKVYNDKNALPDIHRERELARRAFVLGIPTAIPYDVVKVNETYGSVFELLSANSFAKLIANEPENIDKYIDLYVDLVKKIHSTQVGVNDMPHMKETVVKWAAFLKDYLPIEKYEKLTRLVDEVPDINYMMHGDYHIKNVMMQNGEVLLIDMDTLCQGHPVFEFASVFNAYIGFYLTEGKPEKTFMGISYAQGEKIWHDTVAKYFDTNDEEKIKEIENKAALVGYVRLFRRHVRRNGFENPVAKAYLEQVTVLLDKVDTLLF